MYVQRVPARKCVNRRADNTITKIKQKTNEQTTIYKTWKTKIRATRYNINLTKNNIQS
jgi:hypothetical protein